MKIAANIVGALLGAFFIFSAVMVLFKLAPMPPPPPPDTMVGAWMKAFSTGWLTLVKICELVGGVLLMIPKTRNFGLLFIGPVILNILAAHQFVMGDGIFQPALIGISLAALFLLWTAREKFANLAN